MTPEYRGWLVELFASLGKVSVRSVFGFHGLYLGETMFGLVADERVYLKTDEQSRKAFASGNSKPLSYVAPNGDHVVMSYWEIPERLYDEPEELVDWARRAHDVARKSPTARRKKAKRDGMRQPVRRGS